jgi:hypothetical protein
VLACSAGSAVRFALWRVLTSSSGGPAVRLAGSAIGPQAWRGLTGGAIGPKLLRRSARGWLTIHGLAQVELKERMEVIDDAHSADRFEDLNDNDGVWMLQVDTVVLADEAGEQIDRFVFGERHVVPSLDHDRVLLQ